MAVDIQITRKLKYAFRGQGEEGRFSFVSISFTGTIALTKYQALTIKVHDSNSFQFFWNIFFCGFRKLVLCFSPPLNKQHKTKTTNKPQQKQQQHNSFYFLELHILNLMKKLYLAHKTSLFLSQNLSSVYWILF